MASVPEVGTIFLSTLVLLGTIFLAVVAVTRLYRKKDVLAPVWEYAVPFSFVVALTATLGSLFYSDIAQYSPCKLCWLQRIFMYPLVLIFGVAWWKKLQDVRWYAVPLAAIGLVIAAYHYYLQLFSNKLQLIPCDPIMGPCDIVYTFSYGYITIPMMAVIGFAMILVFMWKK